VRRYDGTETILYLETIFPLLYVEQKAGWSSIPAAFPTYFQIRDAGRRAVEFILALETHELELEKQRLELELASSNAAWAAKRDDLLAIASMINARAEGMPSAPTLSAQADAAIVELDRQFVAATAEVNEASSRLRTLRNDLVAASDLPSIAALEERIRTEARLSGLEDALQRFELQKTTLTTLARHHAELLSARSELPADRLTDKDKAKLVLMGELVREQAASYGFSTFPPSGLEISPESYRPQREGFEIGFEMSASDTIRLKWAYQLALLEVARAAETNHAGLVIFDEPQQQKTAKISFKKLLDRAALARASGQ
jgi:hypothetical protein